MRRVKTPAITATADSDREKAVGGDREKTQAGVVETHEKHEGKSGKDSEGATQSQTASSLAMKTEEEEEVGVEGEGQGKGQANHPTTSTSTTAANSEVDPEHKEVTVDMCGLCVYECVSIYMYICM